MNEFYRVLVLIVATCIGVGGYGLMFGVHRKHMVWGMVSAVICCVAYEVGLLCGWGLLVSAIFGSFMTSFYAYVMARILKIPATFMIIMGILPLVPGARLYYTMLGLVNSNMEMFYYYGETALLLAAGIAIGIIAVTAMFRPINSMLKKASEKKSA
ncbi:MAG: threonine/serine exporter family protein [Clostridia bacterium]|nr:threonine/serine exporter family protein [Clostridia bacterium]